MLVFSVIHQEAAMAEVRAAAKVDAQSQTPSVKALRANQIAGIVLRIYV